MERLIRGILRVEFWGPLLVAGLAFLVSAIFISRDDIALVVNAVDIAVWVAILMAYFPVLIRVLREPEVKKDQHLVTGILLLWTALAFSRIWAIVFVLLGRPDYMQNALFTSFCYAAIAFSGYYFIKVPGTSRVGWTYTAFAFALSIAFILIFYTGIAPL